MQQRKIRNSLYLWKLQAGVMILFVIRGKSRGFLNNNKKRQQWWDLCLCIFVKQLEATCPHVVNQDWGRYSAKERLQNPQSKVARQELSLQKSREEQEQEQQANIFNPREHAERLIQIPPHYKLICKIRLHVATGSFYIIVKENN